MSDAQTIIDDANRKEQLTKLSKNLNILLEREAKYGGSPPLDLVNQLEDHRKAIGYIEQFLYGHLSEADLDEALEPLLLAINNGQVVNVRFSTNIYNATPKIVVASIFLITIAVLAIAVATVSGYNIKMFQSESFEGNTGGVSTDLITDTSGIPSAVSTTITIDPSIPTPTPSPVPKFVENFELFESDEALLTAFWVNNAEMANEASLRLAGPPHTSPGSSKSIALHFNIRNPQPELNYSGLERIFPPLDLSDYDLLCLWVEVSTDNQDMDFVVQFGEANSQGEPARHIWKKEVWRNKMSLSALQKGDLCMSLTKTFFQRADWSVEENNEIDLDAIDYFGFFVEGPQGPGIIYLDNIRVE